MAEPDAPLRASRLGAALGRAGSVTGGVGAQMAFEPGRGRTAVPVRSALAGTTVAIAAVTAAAVFGASLITLVSTPHRYGQNWEQELNLGFVGVTRASGAKILSAAPGLTGYAAGNNGQLSVNGRLVLAIGISPVRGQVLEAIGLTRSQLLRVVSWQASALAAAALLVGLPLGVLAGQWAWAVFAGSAGVAPQADVPVPLVLLAIPATVLLAIPATVLLANAIAAGPGWSAARIRPALVLRSE